MLSESGARARIEAMQNPGEKRVNKLMLDFGFQAVDFNSLLKNVNGQEIGEIDALFVYEDHLLIVETTEEANPESSRITNWFTKWSVPANIERIHEKYHLSPSRSPHRLFFCLSEEHPRETSPTLSPFLEDSANKIIYNDEIERYEENVAVVGRWERNNFLNFLEVNRSRGSRQIPAVLFYISNKPAYAFGLSAKELLEICFISRRYKNELGFQRAIDKSRVQKIKEAIIRGGVLAFPNSILINSDPTLLAQKPSRSSCPANVTINIPQDYSSCKVIDGQHRLLGFSQVDDEIARSYSLPVVAFEGLTDAEEIQTFIVINTEQRRVDTNLVLLLKSDIDYSSTDYNYIDKIAVNVVKKLYRDSCLARKIYMGYADQDRNTTCVTLNTLVTAMKQNKFVSRENALFQNSVDDEETPFREIRLLFGIMSACHFPYFLESTDHFFLTNRGLRILFRFVNLYHRNLKAHNITMTRVEAIAQLGEIINEELKEKLNEYYGEGGSRKAVDQLVRVLQERNEAFRNFASDLRRV